MQFDELCALVGALRDRVAELEAKVALEGRDGNRAQIVASGVERWRVDAVSSKRIEPPEITLDLNCAGGSPEISAIVERAVQRGMAQVPEINRSRGSRFK